MSQKTKAERTIDLKGHVPESWYCVDCGVNTAPGLVNRIDMERSFAADALQNEAGVALEFNDWSEVYTVRETVWKAAGMEPFGGCLCVGCIEKRLGRELKPKDFRRGHPFNRPDMPGTPRLLSRRDGPTGANK